MNDYNQPRRKFFKSLANHQPKNNTSTEGDGASKPRRGIHKKRPGQDYLKLWKLAPKDVHSSDDDLDNPYSLANIIKNETEDLGGYRFARGKPADSVPRVNSGNDRRANPSSRRQGARRTTKRAAKQPARKTKAKKQATESPNDNPSSREVLAENDLPEHRDANCGNSTNARSSLLLPEQESVPEDRITSAVEPATANAENLREDYTSSKKSGITESLFEPDQQLEAIDSPRQEESISAAEVTVDDLRTSFKENLSLVDQTPCTESISGISNSWSPSEILTPENEIFLDFTLPSSQETSPVFAGSRFPRIDISPDPEIRKAAPNKKTIKSLLSLPILNKKIGDDTNVNHEEVSASEVPASPVIGERNPQTWKVSPVLGLRTRKPKLPLNEPRDSSISKSPISPSKPTWKPSPVLMQRRAQVKSTAATTSERLDEEWDNYVVARSVPGWFTESPESPMFVKLSDNLKTYSRKKKSDNKKSFVFKSRAVTKVENLPVLGRKTTQVKFSPLNFSGDIRFLAKSQSVGEVQDQASPVLGSRVKASPVLVQRKLGTPTTVSRYDKSTSETRSVPGPSGTSITSTSTLEQRNIGLPNFGNTCFMNATLQALFSLDPITSVLRKVQEGEAPSVLHQSLINLLRSRDSGSVHDLNESLKIFRECLPSVHPAYTRSDEQDAHEFLSRLLVYLAGGGGKFQEAVQQAEFSTEETVSCRRCLETVVKRTETSLLHLYVVGEQSNLVDNLDSSLKGELVSTQCVNCGFAPMDTCLKMASLPKILTVLVNRVSNLHNESPAALYLEKHLVLKAEWMTSQLVSNNPSSTRYRLQAVIHHLGSGHGSGHYVSHAQGTDGQWRLYDDSSVAPVEPSFYQDLKWARSCYVCFYVC